ncbi:MAG: RtcB family protein [Ruminococcus sp.]|nr:RtcB family protein [Ruminococcus sp.]
MIEITGKYNKAIIYADELEISAEGQIRKLLDQSFTVGSKIRIMPDVHAGAGCTIGTTMTIADKAVPNLVGVDIGCGMETIKLTNKRIDLPKLDSFIHKNIPAGMEVRSAPHKYIENTELELLRCWEHVNTQRGELSLGTLGGGNHFIEIDKDEEGDLYLVVHSGSRNIGLQTAQYYQDQAYKLLKSNEDIPYELAYCEGKLLDDYLHDMKILQEFADWNRRAIADTIMRGCKLHEESRFTTIHNYIDMEHMILRKGAVSAQSGEMLLIPINMRDGALICEGKGDPEWNYSAPHGAGRLMSRSEVKQSFTLSAYKKEMKGIYSTTVNSETLDECPMAYKDMDTILSQIGSSVKILKKIKPVYNFKAGENAVRRKKA